MVIRELPRCRIFFADGQKFRTNLLVLFFDLPLQRETATKTALLAEVLKRNNDPALPAKEAEMLYGAIWDISVVKKGDRQLLLCSMETLKNVAMADALSFLRGRLLQPLKEGGFSQTAIGRQKEILRRKLQGLQDDKKAFARRRALEETASGTAFALSADGYLEDLDKIDAEDVFGWYETVLSEGEVKVFFCGEEDERKEVLTLRKDFPGKVCFSEKEEAESRHSASPKLVQEKGEAEQTRLLFGFEGDLEGERRQAAFLLLQRIFGGDPDSLLFQQLREKAGLCYDVKAYGYPLSPYLFVQAGIREEDAKAASKLILSCLEQLKTEGVSERRLKQAKESLLREYEALADQPWAMVDFFAEQALQQKPLSAERFLRQIERIEPEDLLRAAAHLKWKTILLYGGKEERDEA